MLGREKFKELAGKYKYERGEFKVTKDEIKQYFENK
jgi:hypothetical protein